MCCMLSRYAGAVLESVLVSREGEAREEGGEREVWREGRRGRNGRRGEMREEEEGGEEKVWKGIENVMFAVHSSCRVHEAAYTVNSCRASLRVFTLSSSLASVF